MIAKDVIISFSYISSAVSRVKLFDFVAEGFWTKEEEEKILKRRKRLLACVTRFC